MAKAIRVLGLGAFLFVAAVFCGTSANSADRSLSYRKTIPYAQLSCENGRVYSLESYAMTVDGDLITGYLLVTPRSAVHVRFVPMEHGYRYIGRGIWFEGIRRSATLYLSKSHAVSCEVTFATQAL
jgi:hypothetical protein